MTKLYEQYRYEIAPKLMEQFGGSVMEVPRLEKITLNMGFKAIGDRKIIEAATGDMGLIKGRSLWLPWRGSLWRALRSVMAIPSAVR